MFGLPKNINARFTVSVLTYKYELDVTISVADVLNLLSKNRDALTTIETQLLKQLGQSTDMQKFVNALLLSSLGFNVPTVTIEPINAQSPSIFPSYEPSVFPSYEPSIFPSYEPSVFPSYEPSIFPTNKPSIFPTNKPSYEPSIFPTNKPSYEPSIFPTNKPSYEPSICPTMLASCEPSIGPTVLASNKPSYEPSVFPTTMSPSPSPSQSPSQFVVISANDGIKDNHESILCSSGNIALFVVAGAFMGAMLSQLYSVMRKIYSAQNKTTPQQQQQQQQDNIKV